MNRLIVLLTFFLAQTSAASQLELRISQLEQEVRELRALVASLRANHPQRSPEPRQSHTSSLSTYTVQSGDSLWAIARKKRVTVAALKRANPIIDPRRLRIGMTLRLPGSAPSAPRPRATAPPSRNHSAYQIQHGDTLGHIAIAQNTSVSALQRANPGLNPRRLRVGQTIHLPTSSASAPESASYSERVPPPPIRDRPRYDRVPVNHEPSPPEQPPLPDLEDTKFIKIAENLYYRDIANHYATDVATLNRLNQVNLSPDQVVKQGSQLNVPRY